ncbi:hypothetical protein B5X24_HaOG205188 [Helicoverpa armigera]|uniref:Uncharacterized protein n=1 Tax=Helicoverpa armigera TaxID=29058 RepID=A0A2W1BLW7_HELAM|nr:uncharacterized protein LOC110378077 [Helicoverpa armigera]PZC76049.1 hypothetical protein B5X24_HaOG205188 [Helicoverpa armigera]
MSDIFHSSCYTSRTSGYKYRTLSTNTGDRRSRDSREDSAYERKFRELRKAILTRVNKEVNQTHKARHTILDKFTKLDAKIDSMLELQNTVALLRQDLIAAGNSIMDILSKVDRIEGYNSRSEMMSFQSQMTNLRVQARSIAEEKEEQDSIVTHI